METKTPKTIVLAEDDQFLLKGYTMALQESGYIVEGVSNGADVVSTVQKAQPSMLILDLILPNSTGFEILKELRSSDDFKELPIIVATSLGQDEDRDEVMGLGATDYIIKSHTTVQELVDLVSRYMTQ